MKPIFFILALSLLCRTPVRAVCRPPANQPIGLDVREGYLDFINPGELAPYKQALPKVADPEVQAALSSPDTIWYNDESMVFSYQDSMETVVGLRANCVGRDVGETNGPPINKLLNFFGPDERFVFPFRGVAGADGVTNLKSFNFWVPPRTNGKALPVKYSRASNRSRWRWIFPVGTLFGEVLYERSPQGRWVVFEVRTRKRYLEGWAVDLFRPFPTSESLMQGLDKTLPDWPLSMELSALVRHLYNKDTLVPHKMESKAFKEIFPTIQGALDPLPAISPTLVERLLTETPFVSAEGAIWKENGTLETYAPGSQSDFHIVPKGYEMGLIAVNEISCNRCHSETGRKLGQFEFDIQLYGEIWGEDHIFTWHLFKPNNKIYGTFDDSDGSRILNPRLVQAGLVVSEKPNSGDPIYKALKQAFDDPMKEAR